MKKRPTLVSDGYIIHDHWGELYPVPVYLSSRNMIKTTPDGRRVIANGKFVAEIKTLPMICPEYDEFIGYKAVCVDDGDDITYIAKLKIPYEELYGGGGADVTVRTNEENLIHYKKSFVGRCFISSENYYYRVISPDLHIATTVNCAIFSPDWREEWQFLAEDYYLVVLEHVFYSFLEACKEITPKEFGTAFMNLTEALIKEAADQC